MSVKKVRDEIDAQLLPVFIDEADEICPQIGALLRAWHEQPDGSQYPQSLRRLLHTLKGSARMAGSMRIGEIAHAMEERVLAVPPRDQTEYWDNLDADLDRIDSLLETLRNTSGKATSGKQLGHAVSVAVQFGLGRRTSDGDSKPGALGNMLRVRLDTVDSLINQTGEISAVRSDVESEMRFFKEGLQELSNSVTRLHRQLHEVEAQAANQMQAYISKAKNNSDPFDQQDFERVTRLQELTRSMAESMRDVQSVQLSLTKNLDHAGAALLTQAQLSRELQKKLMSVRMLPFSNIGERLYRIVRQTGKELHKRANLELIGGNVELDRGVLEKMTAPFEHLLRNAMVHGVETTQMRIQQGKNPIGEIQLSVRQHTNKLIFEFSDDGAGLNLPLLRDKLMAQGQLQADAVISDEQLAQMIFTSGVSTADQITEIAGRGIGMDIVHSEIAALGGRIEVSSTAGQGTHFKIHLPLTLGLASVLLVRTAGQTYAIPSSLIEQVQQIPAVELAQHYHNGYLEWREQIYPLHYLGSLTDSDPNLPQNLPRNLLLLLSSGEQHIAVHLDEILGARELVVKNTESKSANPPGISGSAITDEGAIVSVLNPVQLAQHIGTNSGHTSQRPQQKLQDKPLVMVVDDSLTVRNNLTRLLSGAGYQVVTAKDGVEALKKIGETQPGMLLLDIEIPYMDGFELTRQLRGDVKTVQLPIIMLTSRTADKHRDYAMQLGVNAYFGKPYQEQALLEKIAEFVPEPE